MPDLFPSQRRPASHPYRIERLSVPLVMRDMYFTRRDPRAGDPVPAFDLPLLGGGRFSSTDLERTGPTLLVFGSLSCPVTEDAAPGLRTLHREFGARVRFVFVYVREAHPGANLPQAHLPSAKHAHAERLRQVHDIDFEIAVDDVEGSLHRALGPKPNSAYLLGRDGRILFRAHWANDTGALRAALDDLSNGVRIRRPQSGALIRPMMRMMRHVAPVLDRAGAGAWGDLWRVAPPIALAAKLLSFIGIRPRARPALSAH